MQTFDELNEWATRALANRPRAIYTVTRSAAGLRLKVWRRA